MQVTNINNRRYLGNKYQLLPFINEVISKECGSFESFVEKKSDEVMNFGIDKIETTDDLEKLDEIYKRYKKGEIYAADIMDDWEKIE